MSRNIVLIGYRGSGKTSVGKRISELVSKKLIIIDEEIVKKTGMSIPEYVEKNGWDAFRKIESKIISSLRNVKDSIIDCGGGIIENKRNIENLKGNGTIFWLKADTLTIAKRIKDSNKRPPLIEGKSSTEEAEEVLQKRIPLYKKSADFEIGTDNKTVEEVCDKILELINNKKNTRICIPITADTIDKALADLKKAEKVTDLIELRIDFIKDINENKLEELLKNTRENRRFSVSRKSSISVKAKEVIVTCRPKFEGGNFDGSEEERILLLKNAIELNTDYVDIEFKTDENFIDNIIKNKKNSKIIISHHNFNETPSEDELKNLYNKIKKLNSDLVKIVTFANSLNDNFKIFELLENKSNLISFCMGLKGQISRILAPKFGSLITFASLEKNKESAPGQISIEKMKNEYNIDFINENTKILGVIGEYAENSKSRHMHNTMFKEKGIDFIYHPLKLEKNELEEFMNNFRKFDFVGAAVTVPYKETIMQFLDKLDKTAKDIGAVNTIVKDNGALIGYNTDYYGAIEALKENTQLENKKILVIGTGGAARAIVYGLKKEKAEITIINRTFEKAQKLAEEFNIKLYKLENMKELIKGNDIIINTTSVGMKPNIDKSIIPEEDFAGGKILMDIVYTPIRTKLIEFAEKANCKTITGERMLIYQAMKQFKLWTKHEPDFKIMEKAIIEQINR